MNVGADTLGWVDASRGESRPIAAQSMLGEALWRVHNQLGSDDFNTVQEKHDITLNYAVEATLSGLQRGAMTTARAHYPAAALGGKPCRVTHKLQHNSLYLSSAAEAQDTLARHLVGVNAHTTMGVARETLHQHMSRVG